MTTSIKTKIQAEKGDYVLVRTPDSSKAKIKAALVKLRGQDSNGALFGRLEKDPHIKATNVTFDEKDIVVNLGRNPPAGKVYGVDLTSRYRASREHDTFGQIHFFTSVEPDTFEKFWSSLDKVESRLNKLGLLGIVSQPIVYEVHPQESIGKYSGYFQKSKDPEKNPHRLAITVSEKTLEHASLAIWPYILLHEFGHAIHLTQLSGLDELEAEWVNYYTETVKCELVSAKDCRRLLEFLDSQTSLNDVLSMLDEEDAAKMKKVVRWIRATRGVSAREMNILLRTNCREEVQSLWPDSLSGPKFEPAITQYACKNYMELFAETFAFYACNRELPKKATRLMEKSLQIARSMMKNGSL